MAVIASGTQVGIGVEAAGRLEKTNLPPVTAEAAELIETLTDTAFWQLMLGDDLAVCDRDIELLCANLRLRMARIRLAYRDEARS